MSRSSNQVLEQEYLQIRAKILEVAAFFDRLANADDSLSGDASKLALLKQGCELLTDGGSDKAARVQLLFSREYDPAWREKFSV